MITTNSSSSHHVYIPDWHHKEAGQDKSESRSVMSSSLWPHGLYSQQKHHQGLTMAQIMNSLLLNSDLNWRFKLKKVGTTTRPFRYDLNQILFEYTVEVRNKFKGLDLIECLMNYGQRFVTLYRRQRSRPSPRKRNAKKQNGCLSRPYR